MKKLLILMIILLLSLSLISLPVKEDASSKDYRVIKKATQKENPQKSRYKKASWFKIFVTNNVTKKTTVRITIPISLVEILADACPESKFHVKDHCHVDLKTILKILRENAPLTLIEVEDDDETIKIWFE